MAAVAWILVSPYVTVVLVAEADSVRAFVTRNYLACVGSGWLAIAAMTYGALVLNATSRVLVLAAAAPLTGLAVWTRRRGRERGDPPDAPPPEPPPLDERKDVRPQKVTADCGRRRRGRGGRAPSRRHPIAPPSRLKANS
jgi:hypothetical protein